MILTPKQSYALELLEGNTKTEILVGGGAGGGKSMIIGFWLLKMALKYPGSRWLMGRAELKRLKETTLVTFLHVCREQGLKPGVHYKLNQNDNYIHFFNDSHIIFRDLKTQPSDPEFEDFGSLDLTGAAIDEASEVSRKLKDIITTRVNRWMSDKFLGKVLMSCNPHKGWLYSDYYLPWTKGTLKPYQAFVPILAADNYNLTAQYIRSLERLPQADKERLLYGNWDYDNDPARLVEFNKINDLWTNTWVPEGEKFITADIAMQGSDMFTLWVWSGYRVKAIFEYPKSTGKEVVGIIKEKAQEYQVPRSNIVYDADGLGAFLEGEGGYLDGAQAFHNGGRVIELPRGVDDLKENYPNLKTQTSYHLAEMIKDGRIYIEPNEYREKISAELGWLKRDRMDKDGKLYILPKDKVKAGLGRSPNHGDAMHMRMYFTLTRAAQRQPAGVGTGDNLLGKGSAYVNGVGGYAGTDGY